MENQDKITVVVATDNFYAILLAALIKSIEVNHKTGEKIDLFIIDDGVSEKNKELISGSGSKDMFTLHWCKTADVVPKDIKIPKDKSAFPVTAYLRIFGPYIIPPTAKRMIYFDVDMIMLKDISILWNMDIGDKVVGAVVDLCDIVGSSWGGIQNYKELGLDGNAKYFNSGLMVIDAVKWREQDISNNVIKSINDNIGSINFPDQYGLNLALYGKWTILAKEWNSYSVLAYDDPNLIHFLDIKPIFKSYNTNKDYYNQFYKYLRLTPYGDFKPISDYRRIFRKAVIKIGKLFK